MLRGFKNRFEKNELTFVSYRGWYQVQSLAVAVLRLKIIVPSLSKCMCILKNTKF